VPRPLPLPRICPDVTLQPSSACVKTQGGQPLRKPLSLAQRETHIPCP
jgi:hypothetical protein